MGVDCCGVFMLMGLLFFSFVFISMSGVEFTMVLIK